MYASGDLPGALRIYDRLLQMDSTNALIHNKRGIVLFELGYPDEAIAAQSEAIRLNPEFADAYLCRGAAWFELYRELCEQPEDSLSGKDRVLHDMKISSTRVLLINDFVEATKLDSWDDWAHNSLGRAYYEVGNYAEAIQSFTDAISLNPRASWAYYNRGLSEMELKEYEASIDDFTKALDADSDDGWAYFQRGEARLRSGDAARGCEDLRRALSLGVSHAGGLIDSFCY